MEDASSSSSSDDDKRRKKEKKKRKREKKKRKKARKRAKKAAKRREESDDDDDDEYEGWAAVDAAQRSRASDADAAWRDKLFGACAEDGDAEDPFGSGWGDAEDGGPALVLVVVVVGRGFPALRGLLRTLARFLSLLPFALAPLLLLFLPALVAVGRRRRRAGVHRFYPCYVVIVTVRRLLMRWLGDGLRV